MRHRRLPTYALLAALLAAPGCVGGPTSPVKPKGEGRISADAWGNVQIAVGGRAFRVKAADLKPIGDISVQAGGKFYNLREGKFAMPETALREVKETSRSFFRVFVPGYVPKPVWIGQAEEDIVLSPIRPLAVAYAFPPTGGKVAARDGSVGVTIPTGMLTNPETRVALSGYQPEITAEDAKDLEADRSDFLAKVKAKLAKAFVLAQAAACEDANDPLPCPPATEAMGVMLTVDGPLQPGTMTVAVDLQKLLRGWNGTGTPPWQTSPGGWTADEIAQARAADVILRTYARITADPDAATYKEVLASDYGVRIDGSTLHFLVRVGVDDTVDGYVRTDVEGVSILGAKLEFTGVSSTAGALPPAALPPALANATKGALTQLGVNAAPLVGMDAASLIGNDAGSLIGLDGASLIGLDGASLIGNDGGSLIGLDGASLIGLDGASLIGLDGASLIGMDGSTLIGNDGGSLVGTVQVPFAAGQAKYRLTVYDEYVWRGQGSVRAVDFEGKALSEWVPIQDDGWFAIRKLPPTKPYFLVEARVGPYQLWGLAIAPGSGVSSVKLDAASTVVAAKTWQDVKLGLLDLVKLLLGNYNTLVGTTKVRLTQQQAQEAVTPKNVDGAAVATSGFGAGAGAGGAAATAPAVLDPAPLGVATTLGLNLNVLTVVPPVLSALPLPVAPPYGGGGTVAPGTADPSVPAAVQPPTFVSTEDNGGKVLVSAGKAIWSVTPGGTYKVELDGSEKPAGLSTWATPSYRGLVAAGNDLFMADNANHAIVRKQPNNSIDLVTYVYDEAGQPVDLGGLQLAADGTFWFTSPGSDRLGRIKVGDATAKLFSPGLSAPQGLALTPDGATLYVADAGSHTIKKVPTGAPTATVVAGAAGQAGDVGGLGPIARFNQPWDVIRDGAGNLIVVDKGNRSVKRLTPGAGGLWAVDLAPLAAGLVGPKGAGLNKNGWLVVADADAGTIKIVK